MSPAVPLPVVVSGPEVVRSPAASRSRTCPPPPTRPGQPRPRRRC